MEWSSEKKLLPGDLIRVKRPIGYYHFGIALSENEVIHFAGPEDDEVLNSENIKIRRADISIFRKTDVIEAKDPFDSPFSRSEIISRAKEYVGSSFFRGKHYDFLLNNCEHFARYAYYGNPKSVQVNRLLSSVAIRTKLVLDKVGKDKKPTNNNVIDVSTDEIDK